MVSYYRTTIINILNLRLRFLIHRLTPLILLRRFDFLASFSFNMYHNNAVLRRHVLILVFTNATGFTVAKSTILSMNSIVNL